jgi:hypothetical protein
VSNTDNKAAREAFVTRCMNAPDITVHPASKACKGNEPTRLFRSKIDAQFPAVSAALADRPG